MMMLGSKADPAVVDDCDSDDSGDEVVVDLTLHEDVEGAADVNESSSVEQAAKKRRRSAASKRNAEVPRPLAVTATGAATVTPPKKRKTKHRHRRADWDAEDLQTDSDVSDASYVYVLENERKGVYTGSCKHPVARLHQHNNGDTPSTRRGRPWRLAAVIGPFGGAVAASRFESLVKQGGAGLGPKVRKAQRAIEASGRASDIRVQMAADGPFDARGTPLTSRQTPVDAQCARELVSTDTTPRRHREPPSRR